MIRELQQNTYPFWGRSRWWWNLEVIIRNHLMLRFQIDFRQELPHMGRKEALTGESLQSLH